MSQPVSHFSPAHDEGKTAPAAQPAVAAEQGNWFHRNRWFTKEPISYTGYQFFRSAMATIPYGFGMALVHRAMGYARVFGERAGLQEAAVKGGIAGFDGLMQKSSELKNKLLTDPTVQAELSKVTGQIADAIKPGKGAMLGRNLSRFAASPINQALQIGVAFTMFRFVGGLIKGQRDKVMDGTNTAEETNQESKNWWQNIKDMVKTNWAAESVGTPIAALTLGFASANFKPFANNAPKLQPGETYGAGFKRAVAHPEAKLLQNAAIWTIAYSIFFEASERLFKDMQLKRGKWKGNTNSLKNVEHDPNVGGYAADGHTAEFHQNEPPPKPKLDILTGDPSICRFVFRRVLPVAVGITGYALMKRSTYLAVGGGMSPVTDILNKSNLGEQTKAFLGDAWREGAATGTFGVLWMATDAWGSWYDKFFANMQNKAEPKPLNAEQSKNHAALLGKLNAKEMAHGHAA